ncbi:phosphoribosylamine--glycine ligase [Roseomonas sp. M0104]|uniref:Phosphoribosylamine--glycine ligase n=1 Tax=Teichococcus coralli TaxID=2545983 RepID=A0A845B9R7_9PROT|nr:phosphoribosylamine--glycine ligase [Pseudoroseomonas coralli]MXP62930.1 phosphoribosylamine--glycine ligase [Pseudoroseomonas coralli]
MRAFSFLALLPLLAACARAPAPILADEPLSPVQAACREEARNAQPVDDFARQMNMNNVNNRERVTHDMRVAELRAYRDCLRRNGLAAPGGVESPRPAQ